jgi:hypothetical protein
MAEELAADLSRANADGVAPMAYVGGDPDAFARSWASARGVVRPRWRVVSTTLIALVAMVPGAAILLVMPLAMTSPWFIQMVDPNNPTLACFSAECPSAYWEAPSLLVGSVYALGIAAIYAGSLAAVSAWLRRDADPARLRTVRSTAVVLPIAMLCDGVLSRMFDDRWGHTAFVDGHWRPAHAWPVLFVVLLAITLAATRAWVVWRGRRPLVAPVPAIDAVPVGS